MKLSFDKRSALVCFFLGLLHWLCSGCEPKTEPVSPQKNQAVLVSCPHFDNTGVKHRCYKVRLPSISENPNIHFDVPAVVFSQHGKQASSEALVYIAGGPGGGGQAYQGSLEFWAYWYQESGIKRDLIIYNPRGLAGSTQGWNCDSLDEASLAQLGEDLSYREDIQRGFYLLKQCYQQLAQYLEAKQIPRQAFLRAVSAAGQAQDMNFIVAALGYQHWHLWGASFGSRVAILGAAHEQVKSVILDSVYPLNVGGLADWADGLNQSMLLWQSHYARSPSSRGGSFAALFDHVLDLLDKQPITLTVPVNIDANTGLDFSEPAPPPAWHNLKTLDVVVNSNRLKSVMFSSLYREDTAEILIRALYEIVDAQAKPVAYSQLKLAVEHFISTMFDPSFNFIYYWSTECVDMPSADPNALAQVLAKHYSNPFPNWREWVAAEAESNICEEPFFNYRPPAYTYTQKPTLIFSGELDPVTPPHWGELASSQIADSSHQVVEGATHGILQSFYCEEQFWERFLTTLDTQVDVSCLNND